MAANKEIEVHLKIAMEEVGKITPWFDEDVNAWVFEHKSYPTVGYAAETANEVIQKYPLVLREFIQERLKGNLNEIVEKHTTGHGGKRAGAGRPIGTKKEATIQMRIPVDIAEWLKQPGMYEHIRQMAQGYRKSLYRRGPGGYR